MPANTDPIYSRLPDVQIVGSVVGPSANTATDGTGANMYLAFTADATNGGFTGRMVLKPIGTTAATVVRVFICTAVGAFTAGTTNTTATTALYAELSLAAWTASNTTASPTYEIPINVPLNASFKILVSFGTSTGAAGNGYNPITIAGKY